MNRPGLRIPRKGVNRVRVSGALLAFSVLALWGCAHPPPPEPGRDHLRFDAEVVRVEVEGGFWGLVAEDGTRYDPAGLPRRFHVEGLAVQVIAKPLGGVTTRMWGEPIRILVIQPRE